MRLEQLKPRFLEAWPRMSKFIDDTVIYIASYMCHIILATYLFSLHRNPSCTGLGEFWRLADDNEASGSSIHRRELIVQKDCDESRAADQALFALGTIMLGALVVALLCHDSKDRALAAVLPKVIGMMVGWAAGAALKKWMQEIGLKLTGGACSGSMAEWQQGECGLHHITLALVNFGVMLGATAVSALIILGVKPCTDSIELGTAAWQDNLENAIMMTWRLTSRSLSVSSAIVWTHVIEGFVLIKASSSTEVGVRLTLFGFAFTFALSRLTSLMQRRIDCLTEEVALLEAAEKCESQESQAAAASGAAAPPPNQKAAVGWNVEKGAKWVWKKGRAEFYRLVESCSGWLVGCLWTDALFAFIGQQDVRRATPLALALLFFALGWLLMTGEDDTLSKGEARDAAKVTRYFVTNALAFIVGWGGVLVVLALQPRLESAGDHFHFFLDLALFLLCGPGLTYGLIRFQLVTAEKYSKMASRSNQPQAMV